MKYLTAIVILAVVLVESSAVSSTIHEGFSYSSGGPRRTIGRVKSSLECHFLCEKLTDCYVWTFFKDGGTYETNCQVGDTETLENSNLVRNEKATTGSKELKYHFYNGYHYSAGSARHITKVRSPQDCAVLCEMFSDCFIFTYYKNTGNGYDDTCYLANTKAFESRLLRRESKAITGVKNEDAKFYDGWSYDAKDDRYISDIGSPEECNALCQQFTDCFVWTYYAKGDGYDNECHMKKVSSFERKKLHRYEKATTGVKKQESRLYEGLSYADSHKRVFSNVHSALECSALCQQYPDCFVFTYHHKEDPDNLRKEKCYLRSDNSFDSNKLHHFNEATTGVKYQDPWKPMVI